MAPLKGGYNCVERPPVFSADGKFLLVCTGRTVLVLAVRTGERVAELRGHTDSVTCIVVSGLPSVPEAPVSRAWTCSLDGTLRLWNILSGTQIKCLYVGRRIVSMVVPAESSQPLAYLSVTSTGRNKGEIIQCDLTTSAIKSLMQTRRTQVLKSSASGDVVGVVDEFSIYMWRSRSNARSKTVYSKPLVCMALDATGTMVAAGSIDGRVNIWKNVGRELKLAESYHWHAHPVESMSFMSDGSYVLSGGMEGVLVIWQVSTGKKQFVPRLGFCLLHIAQSPDPALFAVSSADNMIRILNIGSKTVERTFCGVKPFVRAPGDAIVTKVALEPLGGRMALPTVNGTVQFYDTVADRHAFEVVVVPVAYVAKKTEDQYGRTVATDLSKIFAQRILVTCVTFASDASVMVTVDIRLPEEDLGAASFLKFWKKDSSGSYELQTRVDEPHSGEVLGLAYHPSENVAVTSSAGCDFKMWILNKKDGKDRWRCSSTGSYRRKCMRSVAFSPDGTLLAVSAGEFVTLWNPKTNGLLSVLAPSGPEQQELKRIAFDRSNQYLVGASGGEKPQLTVWSLASLAMCWAYRVEVGALAVDPDGPCFAVLAYDPPVDKGAFLCLFNPESPVPVAVWSLAHGHGGALQFLPRRYLPEDENVQGDRKHSSLVVFNSDREYIMFDPYLPLDEKPVHKIEGRVSLQPLPAYEEMYGRLTAGEGKSEQPQGASAGIQAKKPWGSMLDAPSHVLPPLTTVGERLFQCFLQKV